MNKKLLQKEIKEREEKHLKWDAHKKALNDFVLFIYNWHPSVENLKRIFGRVPIIGLKFGGFEFDLLFVTLEANTIDKYFKEENSLTVTQVDEAIKELTKNIRDIDKLSPKRRGMVFTLSGSILYNDKIFKNKILGLIL
uniref:Uncharacterized protein n=1 Tax=Meloidogyne enterolobii TaxID=390850 RepID=A0A6V7X943_MELEN|nr:unnamed protein product [Meloidogyne enterolobii]